MRKSVMGVVDLERLPDGAKPFFERRRHRIFFPRCFPRNPLKRLISDERFQRIPRQSKRTKPGNSRSPGPRLRRQRESKWPVRDLRQDYRLAETAAFHAATKAFAFASTSFAVIPAR